MTKRTQRQRREARKQHRASDEEASDGTQQIECPICFEQLNRNNSTKLECGHRYCEKCLEKWTTT